MVGVVALAALVTLGACGTSNSDQAGQLKASITTSVSTTDAPHNQADGMFAQQMVPHHRQAVEMADMLLGKGGIDPRVVALAKQIKAAQGPEIEQMQTWLTQWGMPTTPMMPGMGTPGMGMPSHDGMPGMMSDDDMAALQNAQGVAASKVFLSQMIKHHEGAITMAQSEIKDGQYPATTAMARSIVTGQQQEVDTMNEVLASL